MSVPEFDRIADVYDETRRALDVETLRGMKAFFAVHGCRSILEVGVGTGRVSAPLAKAGTAIVGVDISRRMMEKARLKGITNLVLAEATMLPFKGRSFDGVVMAHVFHLLENPLVVLREGARVARVGVFALIRKRDTDRVWFPFYGTEKVPVHATGGSEEDARSKFLEERRERFRRIAEKFNWKWDPSRFRNWQREREILESTPPNEIREISNVLVTETIEDRIARFQKGGYGSFAEMPAEMREEIIKEMRRTSATTAVQPRREVYQMAFWQSSRLLKRG